VGAETVVALSLTALALAVPFYLSGVVVSIALTRIPGPTGLVYAVDLLGAALGSLGVLAFFEFAKIASAVFALGGVAALGAACLHRFAATGRTRAPIVIALGLFTLAGVNDAADAGLRTIYAKGRYLDPAKIEYEYWTIHGQVSVGRSRRGPPFLWSKPAAPGLPSVMLRVLRIDGAAGTRAFAFEEATRNSGGVIAAGNMLATLTLAILWALTFVLVWLVILGPLALSGLPRMDRGSFALAVLYMALVGFGFMLVQIPLMQRFSVYLGHPTYSLAITLFAMILATGAGSLLSDRIPVESRPLWRWLIPLGVSANLVLCTASIQPLIEHAIELGLLARCAVTAILVGVASFPLGLCFPIGLRLVRRISDDAMPWMWGVNGAAGVLASVSALWLSIWSGISTSLVVAACAYALLLVPAVRLGRR